jgi:hypothetical protein
MEPSHRLVIGMNIVLTVAVVGMAGWQYVSSRADDQPRLRRYDVRKPVVMPFRKNGGLPTAPPEGHPVAPGRLTMDLDRG